MSRPEILLLSPMMPEPRALLEQDCVVHDLPAAADREALIAAVAPRVRAVAGFGGVSAGLIGRLPRLEIIANIGVGYDGVDVAAAAARGVVVTNTPDVLTEEVADLAMGLLIATVRRIPQADRFVREGRWLHGPFPLTASLRGRTVGVLGLGRIGEAIARRCAAFGLKVEWHSRRRRPEIPWPWRPGPVELAQSCDILVVVAPGGEATRNLVNAEVLRALGPEGVLINVARGSVVDERALVAALQDGTIAAAGLDVFADEPNVPAELVAMDNVVLLPHVGSASVTTRNAMSRLAVDNLLSWFAGKGPLTPVPETPWPVRLPAPV
ncbi:2-hydroxyacid dehydrogenase [Camelimonas abortus]|uniref:2-hydroxyacid dehydrogenase n=1 Tax=Camelimonas abortus TaxID=1017184 RepID=A0ABV7LF32_9HYPH